MYNPKIQQMTTVVRVQQRTQTNVNGAASISYIDADEPTELCQWKSKGGTEKTDSGSLLILNTAEVTMWYRDDINERSRLLLDGDEDQAYDVKNVEDIENRHIWLVLKAEKVKQR